MIEVVLRRQELIVLSLVRFVPPRRSSYDPGMRKTLLMATAFLALPAFAGSPPLMTCPEVEALSLNGKTKDGIAYSYPAGWHAQPAQVMGKAVIILIRQSAAGYLNAEIEVDIRNALDQRVRERWLKNAVKRGYEVADSVAITGESVSIFRTRPRRKPKKEPTQDMESYRFIAKLAGAHHYVSVRAKASRKNTAQSCRDRLASYALRLAQSIH